MDKKLIQAVCNAEAGMKVKIVQIIYEAGTGDTRILYDANKKRYLTVIKTEECSLL